MKGSGPRVIEPEHIPEGNRESLESVNCRMDKTGFEFRTNSLTSM